MLKQEKLDKSPKKSQSLEESAYFCGEERPGARHTLILHTEFLYLTALYNCFQLHHIYRLWKNKPNPIETNPQNTDINSEAYQNISFPDDRGRKNHPFHSTCHTPCLAYFCSRSISHLCNFLDHCRWAGPSAVCTSQKEAYLY